MLSLLETRLDTVVYRLNLARTRTQSRQMVSHGHVLVNGKRVTIPSFNVKMGDIISFSGKSANLSFIKKLAEESKDTKVPSWLDKSALVGKVKSLPKREDLDIEINERLIVEYYSR
jgi:small subunit ribosomal protein S4